MHLKDALIFINHWHDYAEYIRSLMAPYICISSNVRT